MTETKEEAGADRAPARKDSDMREWAKAAIMPGIVVALLVQGIGGLGVVNTIGNTASNAKEAVGKLETRVHSLEAGGVVATSKMAVVESQLASMLKMLERIDARMEARDGRG